MKVRLKLLLMPALVLLFAGGVALADPIDLISGGLGGWQSTTSSDYDRDGNPYFDNSSDDSGAGDQNLGEYLFNNGFLSGDAYFWGNADGSADSDISFEVSSGSVTATILVEIAGLADSNVFGWFELPAATPPVLHPLFVGTDGSGASASFTPTNPFGFYLTAGGENYFTVASLNTSDSGSQHFAFLTQSIGSSSLFIGAEDTPLSQSDKDYNDMIIRVSVPEPGSLMLLGLGLLSLAGIHRRLS